MTREIICDCCGAEISECVCNNMYSDWVVENGVLINVKNVQDSISIPEGIVEIDTAVFSNCENLTYVMLPKSLEIIGELAFAFCPNLRHVTFNDNLKTIKKEAFLESGLEDISLWELDSIEDLAFYKCDNLTEVTIEGLNKIHIGKGVFRNCINLQTVNLPNNLKEIPEDMFCGCDSLEKIELPCDVEKIGKSAFSHCTVLHTISLPTNLKTIEESTFAFCYNLGKEFSLEFSICDNLTTIKKHAFAFCDGLKVLELPDSLKECDAEAFYECHNLTLTK